MPATDDEDDDDNNNKGSINNEHNKASRSNSQIRQTSIIGEPLLDSSTTASKPRTLPASISIPHPLQNRHHHQQHQHQHQPSPTHSLRETPLTPEESPPFRSSTSGSGRKRSASNLDHDESPEGSPLHVRGSSGDSSISFCLCQPEPKVPRPRNGESFLFARLCKEGNMGGGRGRGFLVARGLLMYGRSIHSLPPEPSGGCGIAEPRACEPGYFENHR